MGDRTDAVAPVGLWSRIRSRLVTSWPWAVALVAAVVAVALWAAPGERAPTPAEALADMRRAARQREIARMVESLGDVVSATVLLRESDAGANDAASVTIEMRAGATLGPETASAIAGLVSSAAPGVKPGDVVVVDAADPARTHRLAPDADVAHKGAALLRLRERVERALADKIRGFFAGMQIECVVVVSAKLELDEVRERILKLDPDRQGEFVVREERMAGGAARAPRPAEQAGANRAAQLPGLAPATDGGEYRKTESVVSYVTQEIVKTGRGLSDVTASVVLFDRLVQASDGTWEYDRSVEKNLEDYRALVARALGATDVRNVEMQYLKSPWSKPPVATTAMKRSAFAMLAPWIALVVAVWFALVALIVASARRRRVPSQQAEAAPAAEASEEALAPGEKLRREAARIVAEDAERAAAVLGRWVMREAS